MNKQIALTINNVMDVFRNPDVITGEKVLKFSVDQTD